MIACRTIGTVARKEGLTRLLAPIQDSIENLTESHFVSHFTDSDTEPVGGSGSSGCPTCSRLSIFKEMQGEPHPEFTGPRPSGRSKGAWEGAEARHLARNSDLNKDVSKLGYLGWGREYPMADNGLPQALPLTQLLICSPLSPAHSFRCLSSSQALCSPISTPTLPEGPAVCQALGPPLSRSPWSLEGAEEGRHLAVCFHPISLHARSFPL